MNGQLWSRRFEATILALSILGAAVLPPLLDAAEGPRVAQFEAEHDPAACSPLHDHEACVQLAKGFRRSAWGWASLLRPVATPRGEFPAQEVRSLRAFAPLPPPRGPPLSLV